MSWTDERVEQLSKLWLEGRSASQIAAELGLGVTRNAVIGKVHRLGLAGRAKAVTAQPAVAAARIKAKTPATPVPEPVRPVEVEAVVVPLRTAATPPVPVPVTDVGLPTTERVTIMDLRETSCRWPMGDPSQAEFRFCGTKTGVGSGPYCAAHARLAFQPTQERRRERNDRYARIA
ncbi:GcrA family cell cycle regulator [Lichenihabitans sp. Uapishka_5]|uniref:GcrA family cell cycle regulator n=1 Tax=Lichenihabitans sp. Uapishka_5 TaxID=3037302 RepID=UPI0029E8159B|nr:GcrA family cell cycle regulator [Lichenihabitans sp. Uapishka_5]MDX7952480.1 GcrA family cell cycle regulator [Lichenihabitans sp. Uapishka_5]